MSHQPSTALSIGTIILALQLAGCSTSSETSGDERAAEVSSQPTQSTQTSTSTQKSVDVGGHELFLRCEGRGSPTIVFLHGLWQAADVGSMPEAHFLALGESFTSRTRWCLYHRANVGKSARLDGHLTAADSVRDLHALLGVAGIDGPHLLVGGSFGGLIATMYAATYPTDVAGLVLLDATLPTDGEVDQLIPQPDRAQVMAQQDQNAERIRVYTSLDQAEALLPRLPDIPMVYLAATQPLEFPAHWPAAKMRALIRRNIDQFASRFPRGRLVPVDSGHAIPDAAAAAEITRILDQLPTG
ncbi:alpha/beta hydrolase [Kribbella turkmenica]|uniref:Alpha/beta hydrolase n=1 Tax=Kribbella turkmenica TaxID=2530375 RepID=A0A4R4WVF6_9ACTN|nr:alpha/beta hydrolase [Kribbella turkmenica]TDD21773.1 alpha/beta hydrolase [Kribbella turkmenica]